ALPSGWIASQPPPPSVSHGSLATLRDWAVREVLRSPPGVLIAGHSMGAALAILAALTVPERVQGLLLVAPAGLPIRKPVYRSIGALGLQLLTRTHAMPDIVTGGRELLSAPRGATRLARSLRRLDLTSQMERIRTARIPTTVVACTTDTLVPPRQCQAVARLL